MITLVKRVIPREWTQEDIDIMKRRPSWVRAEYKLADRRDAEFMYAQAEEKEAS